jgi:hypothetical protein
MRHSPSFFPFLHLSLATALLAAASVPALGNVFANIHGVVHDPEHRPIAGAAVTLKAVDSAFTLRATTGSDGEFELPQAPIGVYRLTITAAGFATAERMLTLDSGTDPVAHVELSIVPATQSVVVEGTIGGFHFNDPRMISAELRYRFHF